MSRGSKPNERRGGRQKGTPNKRTAAREQAVAEMARAIADVIPEAFQGNVHAFLMAIYKDPEMPIEMRIDAAKKAIHFEKPALAAVESSNVLRLVNDVSEEPMSEEEWAEHAMRIADGHEYAALFNETMFDEAGVVVVSDQVALVVDALHVGAVRA
jgi:hypothetical protein